jgi:hypothetical protein
MLSLFCIYSENSLVEHIVQVFAAAGAEIHLWALQRPLETAARWTRGVGPGAKYTLLNRLLASRRNARAEDVLFFTDDDIRFPAEFVQGYCDVLKERGFDLAQPALTHDSFHTHPATLQRCWLTARQQNRVDQMVFSTSGRLLAAMTPFPDLGFTGWAQEFLWARAARANGWGVGIVDRHPVAHNFRPAGKGYDLTLARREMMQALTDCQMTFEPIRTMDACPSNSSLSSLAMSCVAAIETLERHDIYRAIADADAWEGASSETSYGDLLERLPRPFRRYVRVTICLLDRAEWAGDERAATARAQLCSASVHDSSRCVLEMMDRVTPKLTSM